MNIDKDRIKCMFMLSDVPMFEFQHVFEIIRKKKTIVIVIARERKGKKLTTLGIPRRSPIQVLTEPDVA